jgi:ribosomal protein L10
MNREQKTAMVEEVAAQIQESEAVFAIDYRGISVPQAAALRERLTEAGARFRVVKNTLTLLAADKAGAEALKEVLEGPTAFTFVSPESGDVALAAKALAQFKREHDLLDFKGGLMNGEPLTAEQIAELARLPARDVLHGQLGEGVLDHPKARAGVAEPRPQLGGLRHRDPAVVDDEHRHRVLDLRRHLFDDGCFLISVHIDPFVRCDPTGHKEAHTQAGSHERTEVPSANSTCPGLSSPGVSGRNAFGSG